VRPDCGCAGHTCPCVRCRASRCRSRLRGVESEALLPRRIARASCRRTSGKRCASKLKVRCSRTAHSTRENVANSSPPRMRLQCLTVMTVGASNAIGTAWRAEGAGMGAAGGAGGASAEGSASVPTDGLTAPGARSPSRGPSTSSEDWFSAFGDFSSTGGGSSSEAQTLAAHLQTSLEELSSGHRSFGLPRQPEAPATLP
jgi:hypothetical protein